MWPTAMLEAMSRERVRLLAEMALADQSIRSAACTSRELREQVIELRDALGAYTDLEDDLMPLIFGALGEWGRAEVGAMLAEHAIRREEIASAMADLDKLGTFEDPGDVYGMTDALVHLQTAVLAALELEHGLMRDAVDRTDAVNYDGSGG